MEKTLINLQWHVVPSNMIDPKWGDPVEIKAGIRHVCHVRRLDVATYIVELHNKNLKEN